VITTQANRTIPYQPHSEQIDDIAGIRPAIDIIAEINLDRVSNRPASLVIVDAFERFHQEVGATVNVADAVDACIRRQGGRFRLRLDCGMCAHWWPSSITELQPGQIASASRGNEPNKDAAFFTRLRRASGEALFEVF
jgi:hypothetical protein